MSFAKLFLFPSLWPIPSLLYCSPSPQLPRDPHFVRFHVQVDMSLGFLNILPMKARLSKIILRLHIKFPKAQTGIPSKHNITEGFQKSKWKFFMEFSMKGGLQFQFFFLFKNHLKSLPDCVLHIVNRAEYGSQRSDQPENVNFKLIIRVRGLKSIHAKSG